MQGEPFRLFVPAQAQQLHLEFHHLICAPLASELPHYPPQALRGPKSALASPILCCLVEDLPKSGAFCALLEAGTLLPDLLVFLCALEDEE
jgi:hypothetical protein